MIHINNRQQQSRGPEDGLVMPLLQLLGGAVTDKSSHPIAYFRRGYRRWPQTDARE